MAAPCATGFSTSDSLIGIPAPLVQLPVSVLATLYITTRPAENGCIFFHSIVFILRINCAWKTGTVLWNKGMNACGTSMQFLERLVAMRAESGSAIPSVCARRDG